MSQYLILSQVYVQNANSIAGLTWGFPAITSFLGFTHALSRKISTQYNIELTGCAVISNQIKNKVYQPKKYADFEFLQSKNPPVLAKHKKGSAPIIEEGKMNLTISLIIEIANPISMTTDQTKQFESDIQETCYQMRLAGGPIQDIKEIKLLSASTNKEQQTMLKKIKGLIMPGFILLDRHQYLKEHFKKLQRQNPNIELLNAWLDFSALKYHAIPKMKNSKEQPNEKTPADWQYKSKPYKGYLVPIMTGYKAISKLHNPNEIENTRDNETPARFVEAIHSVGEWKGAHSFKSINDIIWRYQYNNPWYLCHQQNNSSNENLQNDLSSPIAELTHFSEAGALNFL